MRSLLHPTSFARNHQAALSRALQFGFMAILLVAASGASCIRRRPIVDFQPPVEFQESPTSEQLAMVINRSQNIQRLESNAVSIVIPNEGQLSTNLAWQRQRSFRMQGSKLGLVGLDLGSNDAEFWMAVKSGPSPVLYYANHQDFDQQMMRQVLPVSPLWLVEAIGIVELDPQLVVAARMRADGFMELQTNVPSAVGNFQRTLVVHPVYGHTLQTFLRDPTGRLLASSTMSEHQHYPSIQYSLPRKVQIQLTPAGTPPLELTLFIGNYTINGLNPIDPSRFQMPDSRGYQFVDLIRLNQGDSNAVSLPGVQPAAPPPAVSYRGFEGNTLFR